MILRKTKQLVSLLAGILLMVLFGCIDEINIQSNSKKNAENVFFNYNGQSPELENVINQLKRKNDSLHFVSDFINLYGYPSWEHSVNIYDTYEQSYTLITPIKNDTINEINMMWIFKITPNYHRFYIVNKSEVDNNEELKFDYFTQKVLNIKPKSGLTFKDSKYNSRSIYITYCNDIYTGSGTSELPLTYQYTYCWTEVYDSGGTFPGMGGDDGMTSESPLPEGGGGGSNSYNSNPLGEQYPWSGLTAAEKTFVINNPGFAKMFLDNAKTASLAVSNLPGLHNGYGDAVRHCFWSALNQKNTGDNLYPYAKLYGDAHEDNPNQPIDEKNMDLHNNNAGYKIGKQAFKEKWSDSQIYEEVLKAAEDGRLQLSL